METQVTEAMLASSDSLNALRDKVSAALCLALGSEYIYIRDLFIDRVVYEVNDGKLYQRAYALNADGDITFDGDATEVEVAYKPTNESADPLRRILRESVTLAEASAAYDKATKTATITIIKPGKSKNDRVYPAEMLRRDHGIFEGAKMFTNHATVSEMKARPEGDVNQWVAQVGKPWCEADGTVKAKATIIDPMFAQKLDNLSEANLLNEMGVSIRAVGTAYEAEESAGDSKQKVLMVERLIACRSVDFVTFPGAGGAVEMLESVATDENDVDVVTEAQMRDRRPDLVELFESAAKKALEAEKATVAENLRTVEQQLAEANQALESEKAAREVAEQRIAEAASAQKKADAAAELAKQLSEAKLPKAAEEKIRKQFAEAESADGFADAIATEKKYVQAVSAGKSGVKGMGAATQVEEAAPTEESLVEKSQKALAESFKAMGYTEEQAKVAAAGRR